jgi:hypothetical protein
VENEPLTRIDPLGLWSWEVSVHWGIGVSLAFGRDPRTERPFFTFKIGKGIKGGFQWDPTGGRPGEGFGDPCKRGVSIGVYADAGIQRGGVGAKYEGSAGFILQADQISGYYRYPGLNDYPKLTVSGGGTWGYQHGASVGLEFSFF